MQLNMESLSSGVLEELLDVGIALSSTQDLEPLLELILSEARRFTTADAATLYLVDGGFLRAEVAQCQTFVDRWGEAEARSLFTSFKLPISMASIAGAAATTREVVNVGDVQDPVSSGGFTYNPAFDAAHDYSTHSNLAVPMLDREGRVIGVLQLINAQDAGGVCPFDAARVKLAQALASQAAVALRNALLTDNLKRAHLDTLYRLGVAAEWRDKETANHINRVAHYSALVAQRLGWSQSEIDLVLHASPMHDVGKLGIPDAILHKPGRLDPTEREIMQAHAIIGANIMKAADNPVMQMARVVALCHHERWDGAGYPRKLAGRQIPQVARIVALVDVYDALSSKRCYKDPFPEERVMAILDEETGHHFDPECVAAFVSDMEEVRAIGRRFADGPQELDRLRTYTLLTLED